VKRLQIVQETLILYIRFLRAARSRSPAGTIIEPI